MKQLSFSDAPAAPPPERNVYTVSRLNREVRQLLERGMPMVWLEGELSNFSAPSSGHWYFSLKDREAQMRCAMFRTQNTGVGFTPKAGQHVLVRGRVTMYEARGDYQLIVEHMEEAGVGALKREFERLKAQARRGRAVCAGAQARAAALPEAHWRGHLAHRRGDSGRPAHSARGGFRRRR